MKKTKYKTMFIIIILVLFCPFNILLAQERAAINGSRMFASIDATFWGPQVSLAYDYYTKEGVFYGLSVSLLNGLDKSINDNTIYLTNRNTRRNISIRYSRVFYKTSRINTFYILKGGLTYDAVINQNRASLLPSLNIGGGVDIKLKENSGIRIEAGVGPPYFASIGYFFTLN
jgi:hypothetical protein